MTKDKFISDLKNLLLNTKDEIPIVDTVKVELKEEVKVELKEEVKEEEEE